MVFSRRRKVKPVAVDPATGEVISPGPFIGLVLISSSVFLYGWSFWSLPFWAASLLLVSWVVMLVLCFRWWTPHPARLVPLGVFSFVWWFVVVTGGGILLDWGA